MVDAKFARKPRAQQAAKQFESSFGQGPVAVCASPGRVNLIGEHVDYMDYPVLPCAINHTITVAMGHSKDKANFLTIRHADATNFQPTDYKTVQDCVIVQGTTPRWASYVISAIYGIIEYIGSDKDVEKVGAMIDAAKGVPSDLLSSFWSKLKEKENSPFKQNLAVFVQGDVPIAAGLSSSSSLTVAVTSCFFKALEYELAPEELARVATRAERYCGTQSGGMDQASIVLSKIGTAQLINFSPLTARVVNLPPSATFVVSNTLAESPKALTAPFRYNKRVVECLLAIWLIQSGESKEPVTKQTLCSTMKKLQSQIGCQLEDLTKYIDKHVKKEPYTRMDLEKCFGKKTLQEFFDTSARKLVWEHNTIFELHRRATHVVGESIRVKQFSTACDDFHSSGGKSMTEEQLLTLMGTLMDGSDQSLTGLYDCSSKEIATMTSMAREAGAYGSRLTGAGWGGCCVSLVHKDKVSKFCGAVSEYYKTFANPVDLNNAVFVVSPDEGATTYAAADL